MVISIDYSIFLCATSKDHCKNYPNTNYFLNVFHKTKNSYLQQVFSKNIADRGVKIGIN